MSSKTAAIISKNYHGIFGIIALSVIFSLSLHENYLLFHTIVELLSIIVAFAVFIITWNSRKILDNNYLLLVGISYFFIGSLDLLHTLTFKGMNIISGNFFFANQFWIATRSMECLTLLLGFFSLRRKKTLNTDIIFLLYFVVSVFLVLAILHWKIFPVCFIENQGQTAFKIYAEYVIICILFTSVVLLFKSRKFFAKPVFNLLLISMIFTIISEFCFTLYISNYDISNQIGHYAKLISFFLIYKANIETGFIQPTRTIFKNLKDSEEQYRSLAENLPEMIFRLDRHFNCIYANDSTRNILPKPKIDLLNGRPYLSLGFPSSLEKNLQKALLASYRQKHIQEVDFETSIKGEEHFFSMQVVPEQRTEGEPETYLIICFDITTLKKAEKELRELNITKDKFFSIIAHDLKNPFTSMLGFSEILSRNASGLSQDRIEHFAGRLNDSAHQAYSLLENLLNWSRIQTGSLAPVKQPLDPAELLREAMKICSPQAEAKGIEILSDITENKKIIADRQMISTVLRNIITNALKFSYPGSSIKVANTIDQNMILFSVADSGMGIEKENQDQILRADSKFSMNGTANEKGTGLGLILCKEFIEHNGGKIWFESEHGLGTTFYFTLPLASSSSPQ